jgi:hypothetical protein
MTDSNIKINEANPTANTENKKIISLNKTIFANKDVITKQFSDATILQIVISLYPTNMSDFQEKIFKTKKRFLYYALNTLWTLTQTDKKFHDEMWNTPPKKTRSGENGKKEIKDLSFTMRIRTIRFSLKFLKNKVKWFEFNTDIKNDIDNYKKNLTNSFINIIKIIDDFSPVRTLTKKTTNNSNISELIKATQPAFIQTNDEDRLTNDQGVTIAIKITADQLPQLLGFLRTNH